jgi:Heavy metal binding domain
MQSNPRRLRAAPRGHIMSYMRFAVCLLLLVCGVLSVLPAQNIPTQDNKVYVCPMDPDVRASKEGVCSRCGMKLVAGLPDPVEYQLDLAVTPRRLAVAQKARLDFVVRDPWKNRPVTNFQVVHERLFHMFVVSQDLQFFVHDHPHLEEGGNFVYDIALPKPGMYRVLGDFYPDGATPQLITKTVIVPGLPPAPVKLQRDYSAKDAENMQVSITSDPPQALVGQKTQLYFRLNPADGLEKLLGAWAHMLAGSDDLIDLIHTHPLIADGGPQVQFSLVFPRARTYRLWVQFQRKGVVNTVHFDVPVSELQ